jgi:predicted dehydrogenase
VDFFEPLKVELKSFFDSVESRENPISDGKSGMETMKVVDACYKSSINQKWVLV